MDNLAVEIHLLLITQDLNLSSSNLKLKPKNNLNFNQCHRLNHSHSHSRSPNQMLKDNKTHQPLLLEPVLDKRAFQIRGQT